MSTNVWENREDNYLLFIKTCLETVGLTPFPPWQNVAKAVKKLSWLWQSFKIVLQRELIWRAVYYIGYLQGLLQHRLLPTQGWHLWWSSFYSTPYVILFRNIWIPNYYLNRISIWCHIFVPYGFFCLVLHATIFSSQNTVFENNRKSLIQHCERSELRSHFEWTKVY